MVQYTTTINGTGDGGQYVNASNGKYKIYYDGHRNVAYGLVTDNGWNSQYFAPIMGKSIEETTSIITSYGTGEEFSALTGQQVEKVYESDAEYHKNAAKDTIGSRIASEMNENQINSLACVHYLWGGLGPSGFSTSAWNDYKAGNKSGMYEWFQSTAFGSGDERWSDCWILFDTGEYHAYGRTLNPSDYTGKNFASIDVDEEGTVYYQDDYPGVLCGDGTIPTSGCGYTSFAMVATDYTKTAITPPDVVSWAGWRYHVPDAGLAYDFFEPATEHFIGSSCTVVRSGDIDQVVSELAKGNLVISSQGPRNFYATRSLYSSFISE